MCTTSISVVVYALWLAFVRAGSARSTVRYRIISPPLVYEVFHFGARPGVHRSFVFLIRHYFNALEYENVYAETWGNKLVSKWKRNKCWYRLCLECVFQMREKNAL